MKKLITNNLIFLPRWFRILWGRIFVYMIGKFGDDKEWYQDMKLCVELTEWIKQCKDNQ
jgi:hypothetical protein